MLQRHLLTLTALILSALLQSQIVLERQVLSCFAFNACDEFCIQSTAGQIDYSSSQGGELNLTAGFEQPNGDLSISLNIEVKFNSCNSLYEAEVKNLSGCTQNEVVRYFWNGVEGDSKRTNLDAITNLAVMTDNGCSFSADYNFESMPVETIACDLVFYNYLSPNGDGDNDTWRIDNITNDKYIENEVTFYNRWGAKVWDARDYDNIEKVWSGKTSDGEALPDGTYYYVVKVDSHEYTGYVELMR